MQCSCLQASSNHRADSEFTDLGSAQREKIWVGAVIPLDVAFYFGADEVGNKKMTIRYCVLIQDKSFFFFFN